jgi:hypothetical protein
MLGLLYPRGRSVYGYWSLVLPGWPSGRAGVVRMTPWFVRMTPRCMSTKHPEMLQSCDQSNPSIHFTDPCVPVRGRTGDLQALQREYRVSGRRCAHTHHAPNLEPTQNRDRRLAMRRTREHRPRSKHERFVETGGTGGRWLQLHNCRPATPTYCPMLTATLACLGPLWVTAIRRPQAAVIQLTHHEA